MRAAPRSVALAFAFGLITATAAFAAYEHSPSPHLNAALKSLQDAENHITESKSTGMHTQAAMSATKSAIEHTKEAIAAGEEK